MHQLNSLFLDGNKRLDRTRYKSGCMRRFFGASPHTVVGVVNYHEYRTLDFIFEKKCDRLAFLGFSKLMLFVIQKSVMHESRIEGFDLWMDQKQLTFHHHHYTNQSAVFCHSIKLWLPKASPWIIGTDMDPKSCAIMVLNEFKSQMVDIV